MFTDCRDECAALEDLLQRIRIGESAVLVLRGEARSPSTASFAYPTTRLSRRAEADARNGRGPVALVDPAQAPAPAGECGSRRRAARTHAAHATRNEPPRPG
jgi:hypothetical protein